MVIALQGHKNNKSVKYDGLVIFMLLGWTALLCADERAARFVVVIAKSSGLCTRHGAGVPRYDHHRRLPLFDTLCQSQPVPMNFRLPIQVD